MRGLPAKNLGEELYEKAFHHSSQWYKFIFKDRYEYEQVNLILAKVSSKNQELTERLCKMVLENLNRFSHEDAYILAYLHLCQ